MTNCPSGNSPFLLALGDCNTEGLVDASAAYPALVARALGVALVNCGHTMSTIREGLEYARRKLNPATAYLLIQYGLVDSWLTFRGAPYVLYYPDNPLRKMARKLVKKLKKVGRKAGLHGLLGVKHLVDKAEYERKLQLIIQRARRLSSDVVICLISTPPHLETQRNPAIQEFNQSMERVAHEGGCLFVDVYRQFSGRSNLYLDSTHLSAEGHQIIAKACLTAIRSGSLGQARVTNHSEP